MKKILFVLLSFSAVGLILLNMAKAKSESDLSEMASILERENIIINEWSLYARENLEINQADKKLMELTQQFPDADWEITEDGEKWEATAFFSTAKGIHEKVSILSASSGHYDQAYMIYEVTGKGWGSETTEFVEKIAMGKINDLFHGNAVIFSCLTSNLGDKMNKSLSDYANGLLSAFEAQEIETVKENSFISTTAYSPLFTESIKGAKSDMNVQIGIRNEGLGGKTNLVVGTPIITIEY